MLPFRIAAADLIIGAACAGCGRPAISVCPQCAAVLVPDPRPARPDPVPRVLRQEPAVEMVASGSYDGPLRSTLTQFKEEGQFGLLRLLSHFLAASICVVSPPGPVALVPIPSTPLTRLKRGHDVVNELARSAASSLAEVGLDCVVARSLVHGRKVADQSGLSAGERAANMNGALRMRSAGPLAGRSVLVVDDILTTGATVAEAVRVLTAAGVRPAGVAVIAATARHTRCKHGTIRLDMEKRSAGGYGQ